MVYVAPGGDPEQDACLIKIGVNYWIEGGEAASRDSPGEEAYVDWDEVVNLATDENIAQYLDDVQIEEIEAACWQNHEHKVQRGHYEPDYY